jgi:DNA polymerase
MADSGGDFERLKRAARQLIEADRILAGDILAPGARLAEPAKPPAAAAPAPSSAAASPQARPHAASPAQAGQYRPANAYAASRQASPASRGVGVPPLGEIELTEAGKHKAAELAQVQEQVRNCRRCGLCQRRTNVVFGEGDPDARLMFIGEAPGEDEDRLGRPFVGRSGELLSRQIAAMGLRREDVYIANVVKCRPPGNRPPTTDEAQACREHLMQQIRIICPKVIVCLGNPASHAMLHTTEGITTLRGHWRELPTDEPALKGIKVMPTFHPAYLLRTYTLENRQKVWSDLQAVMQELGLPLPKKTRAENL